MPRYKTSDGRIITVGEIISPPTETVIRKNKIKRLPSDIFPFSYKNNGKYYIYDITPENADSFKILGVNESINFAFRGINGDSAEYRSYYPENTPRDFYTFSTIFNEQAPYGALLDGIYPLYGFFVLANENVGTYTHIYRCFLTQYNNDNRYLWREVNYLLPFFNNAKNVVAEPDSTPIADDNGFYDNESDVITLPDIDTINICSALATTAIKCHKLSADNVATLFTKFWSNDFFDQIIKNQQAPIDNIINLSTFPFSVKDNGTTGSVDIGTVDMGITAPIVTSQFQEIDFGSIKCSEYYGNSLDYTDTTVSIFLPFIGQKDLDINIIGNAEISLVYRVDIMTGNCNAIISAKRERDGTSLDAVLYIFTGNVGNQIPVTQRVNQSLIKLTQTVQNGLTNAVFGNPSTALISGVAQMAPDIMTMGMTGQPTTRYSMTGNVTTANGYMGVLTPYLIWERPVNVKPSGYDKYYGYPSFFTRKLSDCTGYTQIHELISDAPTGVPADDWEKIKQMLKDGIIIN